MSLTPSIPTTLQEMNEALVLGSLRQHELTEIAECLNLQLQAEIAERKQIEHALRQAKGSYHDLFNSIDEGFCVLEKFAVTAKADSQQRNLKPQLSDYRYIESNPAFEVHSGLMNVTGKSLRQVLPDESAGWCAIYDRIVSTGVPKRFTRTLRKTGRLLELFAFRVDDGAGNRIAVLFSDITERKLVEKTEKRNAVLSASNKKLEKEIVRRQIVEKDLVKSELHEKQLRNRTRQLAHQVLNSQEQERLRISRELHDGIVQTLIGIKIRLVDLRLHGQKLSPAIRKQLTIVQNLVENAVETVHALSQDLRPEQLDILGFIPSLRTLSKQFTQETGIRPTLAVYAGSEKLEDRILTGIYRVLQEALSNISRHAHATKVEIAISKVADQVHIVVHDNGKGLIAKGKTKTPEHAHLGIVGMQERVEMLEGTFNLRCVKRKGTTLTLDIPIALRQTAPA
jgi:signal transduction histidine kinase